MTTSTGSRPQLRQALPALGKHFGMNPAVFARYDAQGNDIEGGYLLVPDQLQPALMGYTIPGFDDAAWALIRRPR